MSTAISRYVLAIEDEQYPVIAESDKAERFLETRMAESDSAPARVSLRDAGDTEGHQLSTVVAIDLQIGDDVEAHTFSLRFPSSEAARDFEKRFLTTGLLIGVVAAGAVGIGVGQGLQQVTTTTSVAPITQAAPRDMDKELAPAVQPDTARRAIAE